MSQSNLTVITAPRTSSFGRRALHGLIMMLAQNVVTRACSLVSQLVLAALLDPADFGLIGLAYTVTTLASTLTSVGVEDVILQRKRTLYIWNGALFWMSLTLCTVGGLLVLALAPLAGLAYHTPHLFGLLAVLALSMPLNALSSVPGMLMRSELRFGVFAVWGSFETVAQALMTVWLAWLGYGAYSFVIPAPVLALARAVVWWSLITTKPKLHAHPRRWKFLVRNTAAAFLSRILVSFIGQGDYMVLGLLASESVVGRYYFGFRLAAQPLWVLAGNLGGVLYPTLIQMKSDPQRQGNAALKASIMLSYCVMPAALIQAAVASPVLHSLFGQKWVTSIPVIQFLSIGLALDAISWIAGTLLAARGEFIVGLRYVLVQVPVFFTLVVIGEMLDQAVGVAVAVCVFYAVTQPVFVYGVYRRVGVSRRQVALIYLLPTLFSAIAVGIGLALSILPMLADRPLARVIVIGITGCVLYAALVKRFSPVVWQQITGNLRDAVKRKIKQ